MSFSPGSLTSTSRYSLMNVDQNNLITPTNTTGEHTVSRPSSSAGTSIYQGDFAVPGISQLPQTYSDIKIPVPLEDNYSQDRYNDGGYAEDDEYYGSEEDENAFVNFALLSHLAVRLRDHVPRGTHVKGRIPYPRAFTGKDIVVRAMYSIQMALQTLSLHRQLFRPKYNEKCKLITGSRRTIKRRLSKLLGVYRVSSFSTDRKSVV